MSGGTRRNPERKQSNLIDRFAQKYRLRIGRDACNDAVVSGRNGDISEFGDGVRLIASIWGYGSFLENAQQVSGRQSPNSLANE